jgi:hypothetical protein
MWQKTKHVNTGDMIQFTEAVYHGRWPDNHCIGQRYIQAQVTEVRNGERKTIAFRVVASSGVAALPVGSDHYRLARNILKRAYRFTAEA